MFQTTTPRGSKGGPIVRFMAVWLCFFEILRNARASNVRCN